MKNTTLITRLKNEFRLYDIEIFNIVRFSGETYKSSFTIFINFDYTYSKYKGMKEVNIVVKRNETYKQAIQRTIDKIENQ